MKYRSKFQGAEIDRLLDQVATTDFEIFAEKKDLDGIASEEFVNARLENYVTKAEAEGSHAELKEDVDDTRRELLGIIDIKVDKVSGKGLSSEDFTSSLKAKLESLENYDDTTIQLQVVGKQDKLENGVNIKTINGQSILGEGDITIEGGGGTGDYYTKEEEDAFRESILDEEGYLYSNGEKVDMRFTRSLLPVGTQIPASANLNTKTYLKIGKYYCTLNVDAKTITNCPTAEAFSMEVFNPLGTNVDDEDTRAYTYRIRVITAYKTGMQYIQYCATSGTAGVWNYNAWAVVPQTAFTLASSKNGGSAALGSATQGVYVAASGKLTKMTYTLAKSVPSNAVFTDTNTKVTSVGNHYTPAENTASQIDAPEGEVVIGLKMDAAGHVVGVVSAAMSGDGGGTGGGEYVGGYPVVRVDNQGDSFELIPNTFSIIDDNGKDIYVGYANPSNPNIVNEYIFAIKGNSSITVYIGGNTVWVNDGKPDMEDGYTYIISVVDRVALYIKVPGSIYWGDGGMTEEPL